MMTGDDDDDSNLPVKLIHGCDEIVADGVLEQKYNFLDYTFQIGPHAYCARSYLDDIQTVTLYGPFTDLENEIEAEAEEISPVVVAYLRRRYAIIERPGKPGEEDRPEI